MTTTVANVLQSCFTTCMNTITRSKRETIYEKAERILSDPDRVRPHRKAAPPRFWVGDVVGDHGTYQAMAMSEDFMTDHGIVGGRLACTCRAGNTPKLCSHAIVAEEMRLRGES